MESLKHLKTSPRNRDVLYECAYCNSRFKEGVKECPNCGASTKDAVKVRDSLELNIKLQNEYDKARQEYMIFTVLSVILPSICLTPFFFIWFFGMVPMFVWFLWRIYNKKRVHVISIIGNVIGIFEFIGFCSFLLTEAYYAI